MANKSLKQLTEDFRQAKANMERDVIGKLPRIIGTTAVLVVKDNFRLEGYDDGFSLTKWEKRKEATNKRYTSRRGVKGTVYNAANKILQQAGNLLAAVNYQEVGSGVKVGVDLGAVPYGKIHNEGLKGRAWGKHVFTMAKRQYMPLDSEGPNKKMNDAFFKKIGIEINKAMKIFKK